MDTQFILQSGVGARSEAKLGNKSSRDLCPSALQPLPLISVETLPSKFLTYPKNSTISYRVFSFGEIQYLNASKISEEEVFKYLLEGIQTSFSKENLTISDFLYLGWLRKISSIGSNKISLGAYCSKCKKQSSAVVEVSDLDFEDITAPELPVTAVFDSVEFSFMPITLKDYFSLKENGQDEDSVAMLAIQCVNHDFKKAYELIYNAPPDWAEVFTQVDKLLSHGTKPIKFKCNNKVSKETCGNELSLSIEGGEVLFHPFRRCEVDVENRIRFGTSSTHKSCGS